MKEANKDQDEPKPIAQQLKEGHATIWLESQKLSGGYAHIRTSQVDDPKWPLIRMKDEAADARRNSTSTESASLVSRRTLQQVVSRRSRLRTLERAGGDHNRGSDHSAEALSIALG